MNYFRIILATAAIATALPALADQSNDGAWSVALTTERGSCDATMAMRLAVNRGRIQDSSMFVQSAGYVEPSGRVVLKVTQGADYVSAEGLIKGASGSGAWRSPTKQCSGHWRASRG